MEETEVNKPSWVRKIWNEIKKLSVFKRNYIEDKSGAHPGAIHGPKIVKPRWHKTGNASKVKYPTNHERVITWRAARMGISVDEYKRKFCN